MSLFVSSPLVGAFQPQNWAQVVTNISQTCVLAISIQGERAELIGPQLEIVFRAADPLSALELHQLLQKLVTQASNNNCVLEIAVGLFLEDRSVFCVQNGMIFLQRNGKVGKIIAADDELKVVEGKLKSDDVFALVAALPADLEQAIISSLQKTINDEEFIEELQPAFAELSTPQQSVAVRVYFASARPSVATAGLPMQQPVSTDTLPTATESIAQPSAPRKLSSIDIATQLQQFPHKIQRAVSRLPQLYMRFTGPLLSKDVYVRKKTTRKMMRIILPLCIIVVVALVFFVVQKNRREQEIKVATNLVNPIETQLTEIKKTVATEPVSARQKTEELVVRLEQNLKEQKDHSWTVTILQQELNRTRDFYNSISGQEELPHLPEFFNLRFVQSDFLATQIDIYKDSLMFLDKGQKKVIALDANKKYQFLPIGDVPEIQDFAFDPKNMYLLGNGLYRFQLDANQAAAQVKTPEDALQGAQFIRTFGSYVYVLNKEKRNIFRYTPAENNTLSAAVGWIKQGEGFDFNDVNSFAIDGSVWLGTKTGQIKKYVSGKQEDFKVVGMKEELSTPIIVYSNENLENIYVLEPQKNRLVILSKKGEFLREVKSNNFSSTTGLVANEKTHKAYVVSGALVYEVAL
jgi:hypothetical protein